MLVLSRRQGEEIVIGNNIRITVTKLNGGRVSIGIDAPPHVQIVRGEIIAEAQEPERDKQEK